MNTDTTRQLDPDAPAFFMFPVKGSAPWKSEEVLRSVLDTGWFVLGERTKGLKRIKPGDHVCFFCVRVGVVAEAIATSFPERRQVDYKGNIGSFPWAIRMTSIRCFFDNPIRPQSAELRSDLDAFQGKDFEAPTWTWLVKGTRYLSGHDFALLVGKLPVDKHSCRANLIMSSFFEEKG